MPRDFSSRLCFFFLFQVFYIDYGTRKPVSRSDLRLLHRRFSHLPAQGIHARLASITPTRQFTQSVKMSESSDTEDKEPKEWPRAASVRFFELVQASSEDDTGVNATIRGRKESQVKKRKNDAPI